jgi:glucose-1-phosphate thymidylyltransferase
MDMKGIILAGGSGTRLYPSTLVMVKQLLPVYDKPMIYYPLSNLITAGIKDILIISTKEAILLFETLLGDGSDLGINLQYKVQEKPNGLAESFILGEEFLNGSSCCLVLGDNIFFGQGFSRKIKQAAKERTGARIFGYHVSDPERYGVVEFNSLREVLSIEEKPDNPKSNYAVTGLYFFDSTVVEKAKNVKPSKRGELEITEVIQQYLDEGSLKCSLLGGGTAWLDSGTHQSLLQASDFVEAIQQRQGLLVGSIEESAYKSNFIDREKLLTLATKYEKSSYGQMLKKIV